MNTPSITIPGIWHFGFETSQLGQIEILQTVILMHSGRMGLPRGRISLGVFFVRPSLAFLGVASGPHSLTLAPLGPRGLQVPGVAGARSLGTWGILESLIHPLGQRGRGPLHGGPCWLGPGLTFTHVLRL